MRDNDMRELITRCHVRVARAKASWYLEVGLLIGVGLLAYNARAWESLPVTLLTLATLVALCFVTVLTRQESNDAEMTLVELRAEVGDEEPTGL